MLEMAWPFLRWDTMADLSELQSAGISKIVGADSTLAENNPVNVSAQGDMGVVDGLSGGGLNSLLSVPTASTAVEVKVGASRLTNRKLVTFQAVDGDFYWGYSNSVTAGTSGNGTLIKKGATAKWAIDPMAAVQAQIWVVSSIAAVHGKVTESS